LIDARNYLASEHLKDGTPVTIRAIRGSDKAAILAAFQELDRESIYTRFFSYKKILTDAELERATEVDFSHVVALVMETVTDGEIRIIGGGRYASDLKLHAAPSAELAFLTADDYRGRGIAGLILAHLITIGRDQGMVRFEAEVLARNKAMLTVFRRTGLAQVQWSEDGVRHVTLPLEAGPPAPT
jgi:GNAT superfamily N-acetyltransferase